MIFLKKSVIIEKLRLCENTVSQMQHIEKIYFHKSRFFSKRLELKADFVV